MALGCGPRRLPLTYAPFRLSPMNPQDLAKRQAAEAALAYVEPGEVLGVGTGSTVNLFIDLLAEQRLVHDIKGDRKSVVTGKSVAVRVDTGGRRNIKQKKTTQNN